MARSVASMTTTAEITPEFGRGGHFAYTTDPELVVADLREFFGGLG
jgi:hypothetical protein